MIKMRHNLDIPFNIIAAGVFAGLLISPIPSASFAQDSTFTIPRSFIHKKSSYQESFNNDLNKTSDKLTKYSFNEPEDSYIKEDHIAAQESATAYLPSLNEGISITKNKISDNQPGTGATLEEISDIISGAAPKKNNYQVSSSKTRSNIKTNIIYEIDSYPEDENIDGIVPPLPEISEAPILSNNKGLKSKGPKNKTPETKDLQIAETTRNAIEQKAGKIIEQMTSSGIKHKYVIEKTNIDDEYHTIDSNSLHGTLNNDNGNIDVEIITQITPASNISSEAREILYTLPQRITGIAPKQEKSYRFAIKRESHSQAVKPEDVHSHQEDSLQISVRKNKSINYSSVLEDAYEMLVSGNFIRAINLYNQVIEANPKSSDARFGLATAYQRAGNKKSAITQYGYLLHSYPDHVEGLNNFLAIIADESPTEAITYLKALSVKRPDYAPFQAQLSTIYQSQGNIDKAIEAMRKALAIDEKNTVYRFNLAVLYDSKESHEQAIRMYQSVLQASKQGLAIPANVGDIQNRLIYLNSL